MRWDEDYTSYFTGKGGGGGEAEVKILTGVIGRDLIYTDFSGHVTTVSDQTFHQHCAGAWTDLGH